MLVATVKVPPVKGFPTCILQLVLQTNRERTGWLATCFFLEVVVQSTQQFRKWDF